MPHLTGIAVVWVCVKLFLFVMWVRETLCSREVAIFVGCNDVNGFFSSAHVFFVCDGCWVVWFVDCSHVVCAQDFCCEFPIWIRVDCGWMPGCMCSIHISS